MVDIGNLLILADSYGTFKGYIPEGYASWYLEEYPEERKDQTDVNKVEQTWWFQLIHEVKCNLLLNCSYSGSTICNTGYDGKDFSYMSFITRLDELIEKDFFKENKVDTMIVSAGTNDSWADAPLGELKYSDWTKEDLYKVFPAIGYMFERINSEVIKTGTRVICLVNTQEIKSEITECLKSACNKYNIEVIELKKVDKIVQHPNIQGMKEIKEILLRHFELTY